MVEGMDKFGSGQRQVADFCEDGTEHLVYIKYGKILLKRENMRF
jgi:hypothetical protein